MTSTPDLRIDGVTVRFGGLVAVEDVSLHAPAGQITGLIGPNGAGKTTTFNACTGIVKPAAGHVHLGDGDLTGMSPARRAQVGLGRTFQRMELWDAMTVAENVALGAEARQVGRAVRHHLWAPRASRHAILARVGEVLDRCGIGGLADLAVGELSTGTRRLVELARAIVSEFSFLLLDEPSSGLDESETEVFGAVLEDLVDRQNIGILLVEHDMALVRKICSYIHVLDFGRLIYEGPTSEALESAVVRNAYLGTEAA